MFILALFPIATMWKQEVVHSLVSESERMHLSLAKPFHWSLDLYSKSSCNKRGQVKPQKQFLFPHQENKSKPKFTPGEDARDWSIILKT